MSEGRLRARVQPGNANNAPRPATSPTNSKPPTTRCAVRGPTPPCGPPAPTPTPTRWRPTSSAPPPTTPPEHAEQLAAAVRDLEFADDVRAVWRAETAVTRDHAERARVAAGLKGIDLDNPAERVTAQEWLDAHLIAQLAAEQDQPVTETDLAPDDAALHATSDGRRPRPERAAEDRADEDVPAQPDERGEDHNRGDGTATAMPTSTPDPPTRSTTSPPHRSE